MYIETLKLRIYPAAIVMTSLFGSIVSPVYATEAPKTQTFFVTAYYSPLPNQCCYAMGGYEEDIAFNGEGIRGADGTGVYPGMIAAPKSVPFGTVIELPSVGIVGTVHDRGSAINVMDNDVHHIDLWMGYGEEGLARAMAWGARTVAGVIYPAGNGPKEHFALEDFDADPSWIAAYAVAPESALIPPVSEGDTANAVRRLQETLAALGYFTDVPNAHFGPGTKAALQKFQSDYGFIGDGTTLTQEVSATLLAASAIAEKNMPVLAEGLAVGSEGESVRQAQKLLRYLTFYRGRTDGKYDDDLRASVLAFQLAFGVIGNDQTTGAGRIGPVTKKAILHAWKQKIVRLKVASMLVKEEIRARAIAEHLPEKILAKGDRGEEVKKLQNFLASHGYIPKSDVTGTFGPRTETALKKYQLDQAIIASANAKGAGIFGPATRMKLSEQVVSFEWERVRAGM